MEPTMLPSAPPERDHYEQPANDQIAIPAKHQHEKSDDLALFKAHYHHLLEPPQEMNASRKFSYASVKEEICKWKSQPPGGSTPN